MENESKVANPLGAKIAKALGFEKAINIELNFELGAANRATVEFYLTEEQSKAIESLGLEDD